jgi:aryl-alcohol dehydrogenase-like predicted oxidoreductase
LDFAAGATANQIALAWVINQPFPAIPMLSTSNPEHLAEGLAAATIRLSPEQVRWLADGGLG